MGYRSGMEAAPVDEISVDRQTGGGMFPFELRRQTSAVPVREGVRLEIADLRDGLGFVHGTRAREAEIPPGAVALHPVKGRLPTLLVHRCPTQRKPKLGPRVSAGFHEGKVFAVCDESIRKRKSRDQRAMTRAF